MAEQDLRKRDEIDDRYKWKLEDMFPSDGAWEEEYLVAQRLAQEARCYEGHLGEGASVFYEFLQKEDELNYHVERLYVYANQRHHQDTTLGKYQALSSKADQIMVESGSATAFAEPEILALGKEMVERYAAECPKQGQRYRRKLDEIFRAAEHTLSAKEEALLAQARELAVAPDNIFSAFNDADVHFHSVHDVMGRRIPVTHGNFISILMGRDRMVRRDAFKHVYEAYQKMGNMVTATFTAHLKQEAFFAKCRNYESVRAMHLSEGNIPEAVYDNLIETVHKHLPALHRYMSLRKKCLGLDRMHMYDLYVPFVESPERTYTYEEAKNLVADALRPMGQEYCDVLRSGMDNGWVDVYENSGKRSGAYSWSAYGTHPYVLMNYQGDLDGVFTLAHEMGHAMHSYYSNSAQPITYAGYLIFVAEVASTCNESLLIHDMLEKSGEEKESKFLMNHYLEMFRSTLFRQTLFAEFEHIVHTRLAAGEPMTKEDLCAIYHDLNVTYYGPDVYVDSEIDYEWMRIPHFYTSYYVYQYATGFSAAVAFASRILKEGQAAVKPYIQEFLKGGCSKDPIDLLKAAGVDMGSPEPVEEALGVFENYLNNFEKVISEKQ